MVRMAGFEPAVSRARGVRFGRLSYILELAPMTRIELAFPDRQSGPFAGWGHGQLVRSAGIEPAWNPTALSRRSVCRFRHEREFDLEDLVGLEPTMLSRRIKNPLPWPLGAQVRDGGSGWFRTTCARVKSPLHLHSGLTLRIRRLDGCGGQPLRFRVARHGNPFAVWSSRDESNIRRSLIKRLLCH